MAEYKLSYFAIKGLAEPIRFLMKYGNVQFEDDRISFEDWARIKPTTPFGQVPLLKFRSHEYNQTVAICRYMAKKVKLAGDDDLENLEIDSMVDTITDMRTKLTVWFYEPNEEFKMSKKDALFNETLPFYMERFDRIVKENNGHFALKKLTWADLFFVSLIDLFDWYTKLDTIGKYKNLCALRDKVLALPNIKKWVEERPKTDF